MKTTKYHYVYKITNNNPTDERKYYIGVRTAKNCAPEDDTKYWGSSKYLNEAIKEIGKEHFSKEILSTWETREQAVLEESRLHTIEDISMNPKFYNKSKQTATGFDVYGRTNGPHSEITRRKISEKAKGRGHSDETKKKLSQYFKGKELGPNPKKGHKGANNPSAKRLNIYNSCDEIVFKCYGNFHKICEENVLPEGGLFQTYLKSTKLYSTKSTQTMAKRNGREKFIGWYVRHA